MGFPKSLLYIRMLIDIKNTPNLIKVRILFIFRRLNLKPTCFIYKSFGWRTFSKSMDFYTTIMGFKNINIFGFSDLTLR